MPAVFAELATRTDFTLEAERLLRDPSLFKWYAIALLALVVYAYANEVERGRFDVVGAGLAIWLADWFNEIVNSLVLEATDRAAIWTTTGPTAYQFLIGLNVEISFMFALAGIVYAKLLPADRSKRIRGMPNRLAIALGLSIFSVAVELFLNDAGVFHWEYWWWNTPFVPLIVIFGYATFFGIAAWVYDMGQARRRQLRVVGTLAAVDLALLAGFGLAGWL
jgi:hypothetical protein